MTDKLYHYSDAPISQIGDVRQRNTNPFNGHGWYPRGLWFAPGRSWKRASLGGCREQKHFDYRYEVRIGAGARIAVLATARDAIDFSARFGSTPFDDGVVTNVRWDEVADEFDGIRLGFAPRWHIHRVEGIDWTETWDIPSGCIWRMQHVDFVDRSGASVPHGPRHQHWLEEYDEPPVTVDRIATDWMIAGAAA